MKWKGISQNAGLIRPYLRGEWGNNVFESPCSVKRGDFFIWRTGEATQETSPGNTAAGNRTHRRDLASAFGSANVALPDIIKMSLNKLAIFHFNGDWRPADETIIFNIGLPRVIGGALLGLLWPCAGALFQGLLRNPMADP